MWKRFKGWITRLGYAAVRRIFPVLCLGRRVFVFRYAEVVEVLQREADFSVVGVYAEKMRRTSGDFFLGMDDGPTYRREAALAHGLMQPDDLDRIRSITRRECESILSLTDPAGSLDVVRDLARVLPTRIVAQFFGVPGPDEATLTRWLLSIFRHLFNNIGDDPQIRAAAEADAAQLRSHIASRMAEPDAAERDDVLARWLQLRHAQGLDDDTVIRNLAGVVLGAVATIARAVPIVIDLLLDRPREFAMARDAADRDDLELVRQVVWEALRFEPHNVALVRSCPRDTELRGRRIAAHTQVFVIIHAAMFDGAAFSTPSRFRTDRPLDRYLHFGHGLHRCFGLRINEVVLPEIVAAILRTRNLRRAPGPEGVLRLDGPYPSTLVVHMGEAG